MKSLLRLLFAAALLAGSAAFAAVFEGRMTLSMSSGKDRAQDLNYAIKGHLIRLELTGKEQFAMIMDAKKMEMTSLMPEQKMYMVMSVQGVAESAQKAATGDDFSVEKTGRSEKILGYNCEEYVSTDKKRGVKTEIWVADGLGTFMGLGAGGGGGGPFGGGRAKGPTWEEAFKGKPGMPLRVVSHDAKGKETFKMEATKIEPGSLPDSLFVPPADYQKFEMPDLGGLNPFRKK